MKDFLCKIICLSFPLLATIGSYAVNIEISNIHLFLFRIAIIVFFLISLLVSNKVYLNKFIVFSLFVLFFWMLWGFFSTFWAPDFRSAIDEILSLFIAFILYFQLSQFRVYNSYRNLDLLRRGWIIALIFTLIIALWEIITGNHLPSYYYIHTPKYIFENNRLAIATFDNPNDYGAFLLLSWPFLLWTLKITKSKIAKLLYTMVLIFTFIIMLYSGSRIAILGIVITSITYFLSAEKLKNKFNIIIYLLTGFTIFNIFLIFSSHYPAFIFEKINHSIFNDNSAKIRINLILTGFYFLIKSYGKGIGAGGFSYVATSDKPYYISYIVNPHNFMIEILSEYGILIFILIISWSYLAVKIILQSMRLLVNKNNNFDYIMANSALGGMIGYIFASSTSSSFIKSSINWMWLASITMMCGYFYQHVVHIRNHK
jgi:O-antigen ligase